MKSDRLRMAFMAVFVLVLVAVFFARGWLGGDSASDLAASAAATAELRAIALQEPLPQELEDEAGEEAPAAAKNSGSAKAQVKALRRAAGNRQPPAYIAGEVWGKLDLREVYDALPNNLYWLLGVPTKDPEILDIRSEVKERWNGAYGKVLSGYASEEEVNAYYDHRELLSSDYIDFAELVLDEYGGDVPDQMRRLLNLSLQLHTARLSEIPGDRVEALERRDEKALAREKWLREKDGAPAGGSD